ncbi:conserved hypothetical protein [Vibrio phage 121E34-1]|nr:conserved hypothetical protein [Vibrio phage 121E34-1]CAH9012381.1 conserved hypothetical protein [Vibrio phage 131E34-1]
MLQELVKNKARDIYSQAGKNVMDAAIAECSKMGLSHTAAKELLAFVVSNDPKVPLVAESHLMARIVNGIELAVSAGVVVDGVNNDAGGSSDATEGALTAATKAVSLTATTLKQMSIEAVRETALELGIEITDQDGNAITRKDLTAAILAKQPPQ